jgi:hypothetical protein
MEQVATMFNKKLNEEFTIKYGRGTINGARKFSIFTLWRT